MSIAARLSRAGAAEIKRGEAVRARQIREKSCNILNED